jgi:hypothetical protein
MRPDQHAKEQLLSQGGNNPVRMTASLVSFNNKAEFDWFADPTPRDSTEWQQLPPPAMCSAVGGSPPLNTVRIFNPAGAGEAASRTSRPMLTARATVMSSTLLVMSTS